MFSPKNLFLSIEVVKVLVFFQFIHRHFRCIVHNWLLLCSRKNMIFFAKYLNTCSLPVLLSYKRNIPFFQTVSASLYTVRQTALHRVSPAAHIFFKGKMSAPLCQSLTSRWRVVFDSSTQVFAFIRRSLGFATSYEWLGRNLFLRRNDCLLMSPQKHDDFDDRTQFNCIRSPYLHVNQLKL